MNCVYWYDDKRPCGSIWTADTSIAQAVADVMKATGFYVVWTIHSEDRLRAAPSYEQALKDLKEWRR